MFLKYLYQEADFKKIASFFTLIYCCIYLISCTDNQSATSSTIEDKSDVQFPVAAKKPKELITHGDKRVDNYFWMRLSDDQKNAETPDAQTQEVLDYLKAENAYTDQMTEHIDSLQSLLFNEITNRIKQTDMSVPYLKNKYYYITRYEEGGEYPIYCRKKGSLDAKEEIILDVNKLAKNYEYYNVAGLKVSENNKILAFSEDTLSRRLYKIRFLNLETGEYLPDEIINTTGGVTWANDNKTVFYTRKDKALRAYKIFKHELGTPSTQDVEVYHEADETFSCYVWKTKSNKYITIGSFATSSSEFRYLSADDLQGEFKVLQEREKDHEYNASHYDGKWYIVTNTDGAKNFKVMVTDENNTSRENWKDFIPYRENVLVEGLEIFKNYMVVNERYDGLTKVKVIPWDNIDNGYYIDFGENVYTAYTSTNPEFDTDKVRLSYTSLTTPASTFDYDMANKSMELKKQVEVVGEFDPSLYQSERIMVKARDGEEVPVSLVYKKGYKKDGNSPLLLYAYGSYGSSMDPYFSSTRLSLLDRGVAFAIAHVRGGQEKGRHWYEDGKLLNKKNTFTDFIDVGQYLVDENYSSSDKMFCMGGSAGGLLVGAVVNMAPDLWKGAIASVPFVDVVSTMLDESIPLTTGEFSEWGNPKDKEYYDYIKSYSPYDNVTAQDYPAILVTTGYHDSQVQYWEPAKWVAKLRALKTDNNPLLLHTEMSAGHGGKSGRFEMYHEVALEYAFLLDLAGRAGTKVKD